MDPQEKESVQKLTWYDQAKAVYDREDNLRPFHEDLYLHYKHGYVVSCPEFFVMARIVPSCMPIGLLRDASIEWKSGDCWWIHCFAGDMISLFTWCPIALGVTGWERHNRPRLYEINSLRHRLYSAKRLDCEPIQQRGEPDTGPPTDSGSDSSIAGC